MPTYTCECCEHDVEVEEPFQVEDRVTCPHCGAIARVTGFVRQPLTELVRAPESFDDGDVTPVHVPQPRKVAPS